MTDERKHHSWKTLQVKIQGMHCANCEVLIERRFKKIVGIRKVTANCSTGTAEITYYGNLDCKALQNAVKDDGYTVSDWRDQTGTFESKNTGRDYLEIGAAFLILVGVYLLLKQLDVLPENFAVPNTTISFGLALLIGLVASMSTCIAVTGGLLVAIAAKHNAANGHLSGVQKFKPHLYFNAGRIISYTILGGAIGALGSTFSLSTEATSLLILLVSLVMIALGLQLLNLLPRLGLIRMPKFIAHWIHDYSERKTKGGAFVLGGLTFFLPCGFTQALQLYVLAKGSMAVGALTMLAFSLGTLPALLSLSAVSSFGSGVFQRYFLKFAGTAVVLLGIINVQSGLTLASTAVNLSATPAGLPKQLESGTQVSGTVTQTVPVVDGKQIVDMKIVGYQYEPNQFTVVRGIPVEWRIDARQAAGCGRIIIAPKAGVRKMLPYGTTAIEFTPEETGEIRFNCGMGMMTPGSKITVIASAASNVAASASANATPSGVVQAPAQTNLQPLSAARQGEIERIIKAYLLQHPEVLQEAMTELEKRQALAEAERHRTAVKENAAILFNSNRQVVLGNPQGDVTFVEFFDYNCAYCKRALADMLDLLKGDPKLKVVLKEFPVLGQSSLEAAQVAIAVRMQDRSGKKYLEFHQKLLAGRGQVDRARALAVAQEIGLDMARLEKDLASEEVKLTIEENLKLAEAMGLNGTPSYVVGSDVVIGAVGVEALREKILAARK
jgi:protein-disulfide isomerase/sulfite exporter TauE/SafE/copper chaperone CopZ